MTEKEKEKFANYVTKVTKIANEKAKLLNLSIEEVEWVNESNTYIMRIIADSKEGLDIDQATDLNTLISDELDKHDFIEEEYMLEVSSPGIERKLKNEEDYLNNINEYIHIDFLNDFEISKTNLVKEVEGTLKAYADECFDVEINIKGRIKTLKIEKNKIKLIRKAIKF